MSMEDSFPRGGKKVTTLKRKPDNDTLFGIVTKKQKKNKVDKNVKQVVEHQQVPTNLGMLSRQAITEGMKLLVCIKNITEHALEVELPGLIVGKVMIDSISDTLVDVLKNVLSDSTKITSVSQVLKTFFHIGQYVPCKIKTIQLTDEKSVILGTLSPRDINSDRRHNSFKKGELIWATVASELDHGYQLDCGVKNCRIFLPNQHVQAEAKLEIGQPIWCKVHRVDTDNAASTLRVGSKRQHIDSILPDENIPLDFILPGTKVEVAVEKVLKNGILCKFLENYTGFIHESQLNPVMRSLNTIKESATMCAYVLYVENITKVAQLSMRSLDSEFELAFERGNKVSGVVIGNNEIGIYFKLNNGEKGWVSNRRLVGSFNDNAKRDLVDQKYPKGSKHKCVILSYSHMDRLYICGIEKELLKEKYFTSKDLKVGELVEGTIKEIKTNGIVVAVGQVRAFIPNIHLTDVMYTENLKKKFVVGKKIKARVYFSSEKTAILTLKSSFIKENKYFEDFDSAQLNEVYPALVLKPKMHGLVLSFYNNIEGYVPAKEFNFQVTQKYRDNPSSFFYSGQVVNVRILNVTAEKIIASLILEGSSTAHFEIGKKVKGIVRKKQKNGLTVFVPKLNIEGFVPVEHLSIDLSLCHPMLKTFKEDDKISNLLIYKIDESEIILSRREAIAYERCDLKVPKFQSIRKNILLRCSVESIEHNGIFVYSPIKNFNKRIFVTKKHITKEKSMPEFKIQQGLLAKVIEIDRANEIIKLSLKSDNVFDKNIQNSISLFSEYLADEEYLRKYGSDNNWPINEYKVCDKVLCTVEKSTEKGCLVKLPNGCKGLVVSTLSGSVKNGMEVEGMVLGYNYQLNYVELCLNQKIIDSINPIQDGIIPENEPYFAVNKLLSREQYVLAVTRKPANSQLVYLPLRLCENDPNGKEKAYYEKDAFKVDICGKYGKKLIGIHRKLKYSLDYTYVLKNTNWSELDSSLISDEMGSHDTSNGTADATDEDSEEENAENDDSLDSEEDDVAPAVNDDIEMEESSDTNKDSGIYSSSVNGISTNESDGESDSEMDENVEEEKTNGNVEKGKTKIRFSGEESRQYHDQDQINCPLAVLPSISNFFDAEVPSKNDESSSEDEDEKESQPKKKKKKLTAAERRAKQKNSVDTKPTIQEAEEVESAEHYEQLLMNNPNSSTIWLKYMAFSLASSEFEKARSIGKRALSAIGTDHQDDKFNIWMTLLNIENTYGSKESFEKEFEEATRSNDALAVYSRVTDLLLECGKTVELEEKIKKMRSKFKSQPDMWIHVAKLYYLMGNFQEARNVKNISLKSITIKKEQYNLILKFAILEFAHGDVDTGIQIFESVLITYPNKVGAWVLYIDQLISKKLFKEARVVLDRAIVYPFPLKAIKSIYNKYRIFEEKYGTPESLASFKEKAKRILQEKIHVVS